jgi:hypothetical protein
MPHPLADLNGKRKHVFTKDGEKFYLRVVTEAQEIISKDGEIKIPRAIQMLGPIGVQARIEKQRQLEKEGRGERLKQPVIDMKPKFLEPSWIDSDEGKAYVQRYANSFAAAQEKGKNPTLFILENEAGEFAVGMYITINDPLRRVALKVPESIGTFVYVDDLITDEKYRGQGMLSRAFDKVLTLMGNPKRGLKNPIEYAVSVTAVEIEKVNEQGNVVSQRSEMLNLLAYALMWEGRKLEDVRLQGRKHMLANNIVQWGDDYYTPLSDIFVRGADGKLDVEEFDRIIDANVERQKAGLTVEGSAVRGGILIGGAPSYDDMKSIRQKGTHNSKVKRDKDPQNSGWQPVPSVSGASADSVAKSKTKIHQ